VYTVPDTVPGCGADDAAEMASIGPVIPAYHDLSRWQFFAGPTYGMDDTAAVHGAKANFGRELSQPIPVSTGYEKPWRTRSRARLQQGGATGLEPATSASRT
jgi:hypothetical protein